MLTVPPARVCRVAAAALVWFLKVNTSPAFSCNNYHTWVRLSAGPGAVGGTSNGNAILEESKLVWFITCNVDPDRIGAGSTKDNWSCSQYMGNATYNYSVITE